MLQESNPLIKLYLTAQERFAEIRAVEDNWPHDPQSTTTSGCGKSG